VRLVDADAVLDKVVYTLANPVSAGLVSHGTQWPGVRLYRPGTQVIQRPEGFFLKGGPTDETVALTITAPPLGAALDADAVSLIERVLHERERAVRAAFRASGRRFLGRSGVLAQRWSSSPRTHEPRRGLSPRLACRDKWRRIEAIARNKDFLSAYAAALESWRAGNRAVVFPAGTFCMARLHGAAIVRSPLTA
jgi:hypothetical protein